MRIPPVVIAVLLAENVGYGAYQATVGRVQLEEPSQFLNPTKNGGLK